MICVYMYIYIYIYIYVDVHIYRYIYIHMIYMEVAVLPSAALLRRLTFEVLSSPYTVIIKDKLTDLYGN